uniref:DDE_Tnp_1_7 domain-containing protein n=1 Tax=Steinernema glaseri TaxID=37863 RepID=A0A1I8AM27_9BILA
MMPRHAKKMKKEPGNSTNPTYSGAFPVSATVKATVSECNKASVGTSTGRTKKAHSRFKSTFSFFFCFCSEHELFRTLHAEDDKGEAQGKKKACQRILTGTLDICGSERRMITMDENVIPGITNRPIRKTSPKPRSRE